MKDIIVFISSTWYIWILIIISSILAYFRPKIRGFLGEKSVAFFLSQLDQSKYKIINNVMLKVKDKTSQIDHVVVSNYGIFVIETKNYKGWIIGDEDSQYWTQVIYKHKEKLYNPIKQNFGHIQILKAFLCEYPQVPYYSIVAFTTNADLKLTVVSDVVYTVNIVKTIKKYTMEVLSDDVRDKITNKLCSGNILDKVNRKEHIQDIHHKLASVNGKIEDGVCPKCGGRLVARKGKYGSFVGCSNYPKCRFTSN